MTSISIAQLALPAVAVLIAFLSYGPQLLFNFVEPSPLGRRETFFFNACIAGTWICYVRACFTDPGRVPSGWKPDDIDQPIHARRQRWCRKCEAFKPPRAHHCKTCQRCIPKMDHHCPWTVNCISYRTFPHFFRFLFYAVVSMTYLEYLLYIRVSLVWENRSLPSYLGPSPVQMIFLLIFSMVNSITLFALAILFVRNVWSLCANVTTIEGWEIERHETLLRRARVLGGYLDGPDGISVKITKQEFPYDIGILPNILQSMNGKALVWLWPLARTPSIEHGFQFEVNGFEDASTSWPPPDPDRIPRQMRRPELDQAFTHGQVQVSSQDHLEAFRQRQQVDLQRFRKEPIPIVRRKPFHQRHDNTESNGEEQSHGFVSTDDSIKGEEAWRNGEGDRLADFGVDENVEFYDEDNLPLAVLLQQRGRRNSSSLGQNVYAATSKPSHKEK